ncbi:hypothetical protein AOQ84DRAFT_422946, partial [Glonium stellatum]
MKQLCRKKDSIPKWLLKFKENSYDSSTVSKQDPFISLAETFDTVFIIIDALDECPRDERHKILQFVTEIVNKLPCAKIFVTSRRESDIVDAFQSNETPTIQIKAESVAADIELFAKDEVSRLRKIQGGKRLRLQNDALEEKIVTTLADRAEGMFLWVNLQLQHLCRVSQARKDRLIEAALDEMPKGLNATYIRIVQQIDAQEPYMKDLGFKCLAWVLYAKRRLHIRELKEALATKSPIENTKDLELDEVDVILESCANLVTIENKIVRPIHYSAQEFFTKPCEETVQGSPLEQLRHPDVVHKFLATTCLWYLSTDVLAKGPYGNIEFRELGWEHPFVIYAARFFDKHLCENIVDEETISLVTNLLQREGPELQAILQAMAVRELGSIYIDFAAVDFFVSATTILYATHLIDIPQIAKQYSGLPMPKYALHRASSTGLVEVMGRLIATGCVIDEKDNDGTTPLYHSCREGHMEAVKLLLGAGADVNAQGGKHGSALHVALLSGHEPVVKQLIDAGVDLNA